MLELENAVENELGNKGKISAQLRTIQRRMMKF
jgi:hypothetical protein